MYEITNSRQILQAIRSGELKPERDREYWSTEERETLCNLYDSGEDISQIALQLQRSENSINQQLASLDKFNPCKSPRVRRRHLYPRCLCTQCTVSSHDCPLYCHCHNEGD